jgi:hypothetical protein
MVHSTPAACAMARKCSTALVLPPVAMITATAFSIAFLRDDVARLQVGLHGLDQHARRLAWVWPTIGSSTLAIVLLQGQAHAQRLEGELMVLAVYMPPQEPLPGMARRSIWQKSSSLILPALNWPTASKTLTMFRSWPL